MQNMFSIGVAVICTVCTLLLIPQSEANACTGMQLETQEGTFVNGRTLEFGMFLDSDIIVVPRNYTFVGNTSLGDGKTWKTKYASVGMMIKGKDLILDGVNEKGLSVGSFYFPGFAKYSVTTPENQAISMSSSDIMQWMLSQFSTVDEIRTAIENNEVAVSPVLTPGFPPEVQPFHFVAYDKSGKSLAIEPLDGKLVLTDNPTGEITNSPTFDWHLTNLRNYVALSPNNASDLSIFGEKIEGLGQGSGMLGLPGDSTPPSRFVRAAVYSATATPVKGEEKAILQLFHILNNFDIPVGSVRGTEKGVEQSDYTMFTAARDLENGRYYYKTYNDQTLRVVELSKFDVNAKTIKKISTKSEQQIVNMSSKLK